MTQQQRTVPQPRPPQNPTFKPPTAHRPENQPIRRPGQDRHDFERIQREEATRTRENHAWQSICIHEGFKPRHGPPLWNPGSTVRFDHFQAVHSDMVISPEQKKVALLRVKAYKDSVPLDQQAPFVMVILPGVAVGAGPALPAPTPLVPAVAITAQPSGQTPVPAVMPPPSAATLSPPAAEILKLSHGGIVDATIVDYVNNNHLAGRVGSSEIQSSSWPGRF